MPFDAALTAAVAKDLREHLLGGRVDKIIQSADLEIAMLFWSGQHNHWLVLCAQAQQAHVQRTPQKQSGGSSEPSAFVMLLRKYLEGARLRTVTQYGVDRVLQLTFQGAGGEAALIVEIMGKYSNVILVNQDTVVLGALKHIRAEENRVRVTLPHHRYVQPPHPMQSPPFQHRAKFDPLHVMAGDLAAALGHFDATMLLWKALLDLLDGLSPALAREVVWVATGALNTVIGPTQDLSSASTLLSLIRERFGPSPGQPSALWRDGKLVEFAPYPLHQYGEPPTLFPDLPALLEAVYTVRRVVDPLAGARGPLLQAIEAGRKTLRRKMASLEAALTSRETIDTLRTQGELILAYQHSIEQQQRELTIPELQCTIPLDPDLTPVENAQRLFKRYQKARDAAAIVPGLLEAVRQDLAYLDQLAVHAAQATDPASLAAVREELREATSDSAAQPQKKKDHGRHAPKGKLAKPAKAGSGPLRTRSTDGMEILVGRSARQNDTVTFQLAGSQDLWFHARQIPGAHVILRNGGRPPNPETLQQVAALAAYHSQGRASTTVPVDYTAVRNVRRIKGGKPGLVHYSGETTLNVRPAGGPDQPNLG